MSRALSTLFREQTENLTQKRIFRLISIEVAKLCMASTVEGSAVVQVPSVDGFYEGMSVTIREASDLYLVESIDAGALTVTLDKAVDATLSESPVWHVFNMVDANHDVVLAGVRYMMFPCKFSELQVQSDGSITNSKLTLANVSREIMYYVEREDGLRGRSVRLATVFEDHVDEAFAWHPDGTLDIFPNASPHNPTEDLFTEHFVIDGYTASETTVEFTLLPSVDLTIQVPRRKFTKGSCYWEYKDPDSCGYTGELTTCEKTFEDCENHGNTLRFGGFPGIVNTRRVRL